MVRKLLIILASSSPRRIELLRALGLEFKVDPSTIDESQIDYSAPRERAVKAAYLKACQVAKKYSEGIIIAADTVVSLNDKVFGKPGSEQEARQMLQQLSGRQHQVITAIALRQAGKNYSLIDAEESRVVMKPLSPEEIEQYLKTTEPMDKAGAYAIQGHGRNLIQSFAGSYCNIVGLPLERLKLALKFLQGL